MRSDFPDLLQAVSYALTSANSYGSGDRADTAPPTALHVVEDGIVHLSIKVFPGGLAPP